MDAAGLTELDKRIKEQNGEYYELYDALAKNLKKKEQIELLECNRQFVPDTKHEVNEYAIAKITKVQMIGTQPFWESRTIQFYLLVFFSYLDSPPIDRYTLLWMPG